jgi:hypothetical protein
VLGPEPRDPARGEQLSFQVRHRGQRQLEPVDPQGAVSPGDRPPERDTRTADEHGPRLAGPGGRHQGSVGCEGGQEVVEPRTEARARRRVQRIDTARHEVADTGWHLGDPERPIGTRSGDPELVFAELDQRRRGGEPELPACRRGHRPGVVDRIHDLHRRLQDLLGTTVQIGPVLGGEQGCRQGGREAVDPGAAGRRSQAADRLPGELEEPLAELPVTPDAPAEAEDDLAFVARAGPPAPSRLGDDQPAGGRTDVDGRLAHPTRVAAVGDRSVTTV